LESLKGLLVLIGVLIAFSIVVSILTHPAKEGQKNSWGDFFRNLWVLIVIIIVMVFILKGCHVI
jgi:hypothetical protein